jgi:hypothetical protein
MSPAKKLALVEKISPRAPTPREADKPVSILDQRFSYQGAVDTDLRARFKAMGFKTPKPQRPKFGK